MLDISYSSPYLPLLLYQPCRRLELYVPWKKLQPLAQELDAQVRLLFGTVSLEESWGSQAIGGTSKNGWFMTRKIVNQLDDFGVPLEKHPYDYNQLFEKYGLWVNIPS